jgi:hypothetical protein
MTRHATRQVRLIRVANDAVNGTHLHVMRSGTMAEVLTYLRSAYIHCAQGTQFFYDNGTADTLLRPLV